jgi:hypothetical protein
MNLTFEESKSGAHHHIMADVICSTWWCWCSWLLSSNCAASSWLLHCKHSLYVMATLVCLGSPGCSFRSPAGHQCLEWGSVGISCVGRVASSAPSQSRSLLQSVLQSNFCSLESACIHHHLIFFAMWWSLHIASFMLLVEYFVNSTCDLWGVRLCGRV